MWKQKETGRVGRGYKRDLNGLRRGRKRLEGLIKKDWQKLKAVEKRIGPG